jgi:hypothetical protein
MLKYYEYCINPIRFKHFINKQKKEIIVKKWIYYFEKNHLYDHCSNSHAILLFYSKRT